MPVSDFARMRRPDSLAEFEDGLRKRILFEGTASLRFDAFEPGFGERMVRCDEREPSDNDARKRLSWHIHTAQKLSTPKRTLFGFSRNSCTILCAGMPLPCTSRFQPLTAKCVSSSLRGGAHGLVTGEQDEGARPGSDRRSAQSIFRGLRRQPGSAGSGIFDQMQGHLLLVVEWTADLDGPTRPLAPATVSKIGEIVASNARA